MRKKNDVYVVTLNGLVENELHRLLRTVPRRKVMAHTVRVDSTRARSGYVVAFDPSTQPLSLDHPAPRHPARATPLCSDNQVIAGMYVHIWLPLGGDDFAGKCNPIKSTIITLARRQWY